MVDRIGAEQNHAATNHTQRPNEDVHRAPARSSLEREAETAPESAWLFAWLKSAGLYLAAVAAYLGLATGFIKAWEKFVAAGEAPGFTTYAVAAVLALPLLLAFAFNLRPALRRRRERSLRPTGVGDPGYFTTAPRNADPFHFFFTGYDRFLEWAADPKAPLLHLSGLSGSGKSSLLSAFLKAGLAAHEAPKRTRLLIVRSYTDPLVAMKAALLGELWKRKPAGYDELSPLETLHKAAGQLSGGERLLVAFDQFEEFFLLRAESRADTVPTTSEGPTAVVPDADVAPLRQFLSDFCKNPPNRVALLLSYREDHRILLAPLGLPPRNEGQNHMTVEPLDFAVAAKFLNSCPGLSVPEDRMQRVLSEAARYEGGRVVMRPIVANLLGVILRQMSGHPSLWKRTGDLLRGYVRDTLGTETTEERKRVLRALVTDFHTARPRTLGALARETKFDEAALERELERFEHAGLLRPLDAPDATRTQRTWQISHDFMASLIERIVDETQRSLWRVIRPWLAPAVLLLAVGIGIGWPWLQKQLAIDSLTNAGFTWNDETATIVAGTDKAREIDTLQRIAPQLRLLRPRVLIISTCTKLNDLNGLQGLVELEHIDLSFCDQLSNINALNGLVNLEYLDLNRCGSVQNFKVLTSLTNLSDLNLRECRVPDGEDLRSLVKMEKLDLRGCDKLENINGVQGLLNLKHVELDSCKHLRDIGGLRDLAHLQYVHLNFCDGLLDASALKSLIALQDLEAMNCKILPDLDYLKPLVNLERVDLRGCAVLANLEGLRDHVKLRELKLGACPVLKNLEGLDGLVNLLQLDLSECYALGNIDALKGDANLEDLDLRHCIVLKQIDSLYGLKHLKKIQLLGCAALTAKNVRDLQTALPTITIP